MSSRRVLARRQIVFDRVCAGPCVRQKDTLRFVSNAYSKSQPQVPTSWCCRSSDEYQGEAVLEHSLPELMENDQRIRALHAAFKSSPTQLGGGPLFKKLFEAVIGKWVRGAICSARCRNLAGVLLSVNFWPSEVPRGRQPR